MKNIFIYLISILLSSCSYDNFFRGASFDEAMEGWFIGAIIFFFIYQIFFRPSDNDDE